jgi:hypothetical protein
MRLTTTITIAAAALLAASPISAQNAAAPANDTAVTDANAASTNEAGALPADNAAVPVATEAPLDTNVTAVDQNYNQPAPPERKGFPWGVLGLLGLLGLIPRIRRGA